jgi:hypothetical protein
VRSRLLAVALVFAIFALMLALTLETEAGGAEPGANDTAAADTASSLLAFTGFSESFVAMCTVEARCLQYNSSSCQTACLNALGFYPYLGGYFLAPAAPPPHAPAPALPVEESHDCNSRSSCSADKEEAEATFYILTIAIAIAMLGNSSFCPQKICFPISMISLLVLLALVFVFVTEWDLLPVVWLAAGILAILIYVSMAVGALIRFKTGKPPSGRLAFLVADFSDLRQASYARYVTQLLKDRTSRGGDARRELEAGKRTGKLTWEGSEALEAAMAEHESQRYGLVANVKALLGLSRREEAIFVPVRFALSTCASFLGLVYLARRWVVLGERAREYLEHIADEYLVEALYRIDAVSITVQNLTGVSPIAELSLRSGVAFVDKHTRSAAGAAYAATLTSAIIAVLFFCVASFMLIASFRSSVLKARAGQYDFKASKVQFKNSWAFTGGHVANTLVAFFMIGFLLGLVVFVLAWTFTWWLVKFLFTGPYQSALLTTIGTFAFNSLLNLAVAKCLSGPRLIKRRFWWMFCACRGV